MAEQEKVIVGMSGGVDSSVAALLLIEQGYHVEGLFMKNWDEDDGTEYCTAKADYADAQAVADRLGIPLHGANFAAEYWDNVFEHFLTEYRAGRTPNPDILCNREIKFRAFLDYALALGADRIATGHYVRLGQYDGRPALLKGLDGNKDQSYFLHAVGHRELGRSLFPVGELEKSAVRARAQAAGLETHDKKDSTGICFIGERRFKDFLQQYLPAQPGVIETLDGERLERNVLLVVQGNEHPALFAPALRVGELFWIAGEAPALPLRCQAKIRYRQADQACTVIPEGDHFHVAFDEAQRAVTPGQSLVLYDGERCLGGGVIEAAVPARSLAA